MEKLRYLGLSEYEIKVYLTLLREGPLKGGDVSQKSGVPHGRVYNVLEKLIERGFVSVLETKPKIFKAIEPEIVIREAIRRRHEELTKLEEDMLKNIKDLSKPKTEKTKIEERITVLRGMKVIAPLMDAQYRTAKKYIKRMFTFDYTPDHVVQSQNIALEHGVKIRLLATQINEDKIKLMKECIKRGIEVRYYSVEEIRLIIVDGNFSIIGIMDPKSPETRVGILVESRELTKGLEYYFDFLWKKAKIIE